MYYRVLVIMSTFSICINASQITKRWIQHAPPSVYSLKTLAASAVVFHSIKDFKPSESNIPLMVDIFNTSILPEELKQCAQKMVFVRHYLQFPEPRNEIEGSYVHLLLAFVRNKEITLYPPGEYKGSDEKQGFYLKTNTHGCYVPNYDTLINYYLNNCDMNSCHKWPGLIPLFKTKSSCAITSSNVTLYTDDNFKPILKKIVLLPTLQELQINGTSITTLPKCISHATNLTRLNLENNKLSDLPDSIQTLSTLFSLELRKNHFIHIPKIILAIPQLQYLAISYKEDVNNTTNEINNTIIKILKDKKVEVRREIHATEEVDIYDYHTVHQ